MAAKSFTMISFLCLAIKWTFARGSWPRLDTCGRWGVKAAESRSSNLLFQYVTPLICAFTFTYYLCSNYIVNYAPTKYDDYEYPPWGEAIGMCMALSSIVCIPAYLIIDFIRTPGASAAEVSYLMADSDKELFKEMADNDDTRVPASPSVQSKGLREGTVDE